LRPPADFLLRNASVVTLDQARPTAAIVAIKGNRILHVGGEGEAESLVGVKTRIIDCAGKAIIPGFNDAHCHPLALAASLLSVDCGPASARSIGELQARICQRAEQTPKGEWIRATGYNEFYLAERRHPDRWDLDQAAPDHPVKLSHRSGHACVLNSLALKLLGIGRETPEPQGGIMERDLESGDPNGLLFEMNPYVEKLMPPLSDGELERGMALTNEEWLCHGITSLQDATWTDSLKRWQTLRRFKERGKLSQRLSMMIGTEDIGGIEEFEGKGLPQKSEAGATLRLGGVKIVLHTTTGRLNPPQEELNDLACRVHRAGLQLAFHVIKENEVEAAISALEYALLRAPQTPNRDHRHRLEHCSVCPPHLVKRLKNVQAVVVTQPSFIYYSGERYLATVPPAELDWLYPIGSLLRSGLKVAASSDSPVVPSNPFIGIYAAVTRTAETGQTLLPQEGISTLKALEMYTLNSAYASFEEGVKGRLAPGYLADLAVVGADPTQASPETLKAIEVLMTMIDGEIVWQR